MTNIPTFDEIHVISDLHMGGLPGFQILRETQRLAGYIQWVAQQCPTGEVALVLNGDVIDTLAEEVGGYVAFDNAVQVVQRIMGSDPNFSPVWDALAALVAKPGRTLVIMIGNHDIELAFPAVQQAIVERLAGQDLASRARIHFSTIGAGFTCMVGNARIFCTHGNEVDAWNFIHYEHLSKAARRLNSGRPLPPEDWEPNAGTKMVKDVMNNVKRRYLSYRAVKGWREMIDLVPKMPPELAATVIVQEQLGLALNRAERGEEAERVLLELIARRGPSSETCGILGRVYKDRWETARRTGSAMLAKGLLEKAIEAYLRGFEADWRDAYPGINAVTLMELKEPPDARRLEILPVVTYAVKRRLTGGTPDYWDFATLLELAVLAKDEAAAADALARSLAAIRETWEPETTLRNLRLIGEARTARGEQSPPWINDVETELNRAAVASG